MGYSRTGVKFTTGTYLTDLVCLLIFGTLKVKWVGLPMGQISSCYYFWTVIIVKLVIALFGRKMKLTRRFTAN